MRGDKHPPFVEPCAAVVRPCTDAITPPAGADGDNDAPPDHLDPSPLTRSRRRFGASGASLVWLLNGVISALAVVTLVETRNLTPAAPGLVPWWAICALFGAAEVFVVHVQFRREAHSVSLSEVPLVLGLATLSPFALVAAQLVGAGGALLVHRRQPPLKLAFNLSRFVFETNVAVVIFYGLRSDRPPSSPDTWVAAFVATAIVSLLGVLLIFVAISLAEGGVVRAALTEPLAFGVVASVLSTSVGLESVLLATVSPSALTLLAVPVIGLYLADRAYVAERERHQSLEFLYDSTRLLHEHTDFESASGELLDKCRETFRANVAFLFYASAERGILASASESGRTLVTVANDELAWWSATARRLDAGAILDVGRDDLDLLDPIATRDAMVAPLRSAATTVGMLIAGGRLGDVTHFRAEDLRLFETLARHVSVAIENGHLEQSLAELRNLEDQLTHQAYHDPLTSLPNRALFTERVREATNSGSKDFSVMFIDLDDFKVVNDTLGHAAGDALLVAVSKRLLRSLRPDDLVSRLGGDEFAVLVMTSDIKEVARTAGRIIATLQEPVVAGPHRMHVGASIGIATPSEGGATGDVLLRNADIAMYHAKAAGKGSYQIFSDEMHAATLARRRLQEDLRNAIADGQFDVHYQPIVSVATAEVVSFEALVRWRHPSRGLLSPGEFLPAAEHSGLLPAIDRVVMKEACRQLALWHALGASVRLTVNVSARSIDDALVDRIVETLETTRIAPAGLVVEVTENVLVDDDPCRVDVLARLRALGVQIALDDFGTGYSSLGYLRRLPIDVVKLAKEFVDDVDSSDDARDLAAGIVALCHRLSLTVVAEGVERPTQLRELSDAGVDFAQGYYFAEPMPGEVVTEALRAGRPVVRNLGSVGNDHRSGFTELIS